MEKPYIVDFTPSFDLVKKQMVNVPVHKSSLDIVQELEALLIERFEQGYDLDQMLNQVWDPSVSAHPTGIISVFKKRKP